jgi:GPH family glycoside/pentoside/hexuronide:cation symporter
MTIIAGVFAVFAVICYLLCFSLVRERVEVPQNTSKLSLAAMARNTAANRALLGIIAAAIMLLLGQLGMTGMAPYVFPVYYNSASAQSLSSMTGSIAMLVICAPFAGKLAAKFGKKELSVASCLFGAAIWLICLVARPQDANVFVIFYTLAMIGIGFFNTVIWAMITDVIDDAEVKNGVREDGTIYALYSFARKLGQALSAGMIGSILTAIGYNDVVAADPASYPGVMDQIFNWSCLIPAIGLILVAAALLFIYPLGKKKVEENTAALASRR